LSSQKNRFRACSVAISGKPYNPNQEYNSPKGTINGKGRFFDRFGAEIGFRFFLRRRVNFLEKATLWRRGRVVRPERTFRFLLQTLTLSRGFQLNRLTPVFYGRLTILNQAGAVSVAAWIRAVACGHRFRRCVPIVPIKS